MTNRVISGTERHNLMRLIAEGQVTATGRTPAPPEIQRVPVDRPDRLKVPKGATTLQGIAKILDDPAAHGLTPVPGRTLPKGHQWFGHDIPGRGGAAARRLRQQARLAAKKGT